MGCEHDEEPSQVCWSCTENQISGAWDRGYRRAIEDAAQKLHNEGLPTGANSIRDLLPKDDDKEGA